MVMGEDSCSEGRDFESQTILHILVVKIAVFENTNINEKETGDGPFLKNFVTKNFQKSANLVTLSSDDVIT